MCLAVRKLDLFPREERKGEEGGSARQGPHSRRGFPGSRRSPSPGQGPPGHHNVHLWRVGVFAKTEVHSTISAFPARLWWAGSGRTHEGLAGRMEGEGDEGPQQTPMTQVTRVQDTHTHKGQNQRESPQVPVLPLCVPLFILQPASDSSEMSSRAPRGRSLETSPHCRVGKQLTCLHPEGRHRRLGPRTLLPTRRTVSC